MIKKDTNNQNDILRALDSAIAEKKLAKDVISNIGPMLVNYMTPTFDEQTRVFKDGLDSISQAIANIKFNSPVFNVPDIKIPAINIPEVKLPIINVPKSDITFDTKSLEKSLTASIKALKQPIVNVPKANIEVKVPKMDFKWPEGDMSVKGIMELAGVDLENPLPVQIRDKNGKPVDFNLGGTSSKSGGGPIKNEKGPINQDNPISVTGTVDLGVTDNAVLDSIDASLASKYITGISDGRRVVTTAGTRVTLAASTVCKKVDITAETDNTGIVVVGGTSVVAALGTRQGVPLNAGDSYSLEIDNLADINLDATVSGDGVTFVFFT